MHNIDNACILTYFIIIIIYSCVFYYFRLIK